MKIIKKGSQTVKTSVRVLAVVKNFRTFLLASVAGSYNQPSKVILDRYFVRSCSYTHAGSTYTYLLADPGGH